MYLEKDLNKIVFVSVVFGSGIAICFSMLAEKYLTFGFDHWIIYGAVVAALGWLALMIIRKQIDKTIVKRAEQKKNIDDINRNAS